MSQSVLEPEIVDEQAGYVATACSLAAYLDQESSFKPLGSRVVVYVKPVAKRTPGGIVLPDAMSDKDPLSRGIVVAIGSSKNRKDFQSELKVMDEVTFVRHTGHVIRIEDEECKILEEDNILARV